MLSYLTRRLIASIIVIFGIMLVTFMLLHVVSSSPARAVLGPKAQPVAIAAFNHDHGYDLPLWHQFLQYVNQTLHGNFGYSYKQNQSVTDLFKENAGRSALLSGVSLVIAVLIAVPLGIWQGVRRNSVFDYTATTMSFTFYSMPIFFTAILLIDIFSIRLGWLPSAASSRTTVIGVLEQPQTMILPVASLVIVSVAAFSRYQRSAALDNLAQDYIRVARAKGLSERSVLYRHLLRNCSLPLVTLIGLSIPDLLAGNLITEEVFNYPGLGLMFFNALGNEDYPILLAYTLIGGILVVIGNFIADVSLSIADPRIRLA
jgi:peptide/nickel transport system permease protein